MPRVEREAGVSLFWQEWGEGPRGEQLLPDAQFVKLEGRAISRPELTAAVVRRITGASAERLS